MKGRFYRLYGFLIQSDLPLFVPVIHPRGEKAGIRVLQAQQASLFSSPKRSLSFNKIHYHPLADGTVEIRFFSSHECRIEPDGKTVYFKKINSPEARKFKNSSRVFAHFVRNNVLSFCLLKRGVESLHGSAVVVQNKVLGFVGQSTYGKSTLAAAFFQKGFKVFADDLLAIRSSGKKFEASAGAPHLKLFHETARKFLPSRKGIHMNPIAKKRIYPLPGQNFREHSLPVAALYVLHPRYLKRTSPEIRIRPFKHREAVINLIRTTHNLIVQDPERIRKQFVFASRLASAVPIRAVSFPRDFERVPELREALLRDAARLSA